MITMHCVMLIFVQTFCRLILLTTSLYCMATGCSIAPSFICLTNIPSPVLTLPIAIACPTPLLYAVAEVGFLPRRASGTSEYQLQELRALRVIVCSSYLYSDIQKQTFYIQCLRRGCCAAFHGSTTCQIHQARPMRGGFRNRTGSNLDDETLAENVCTAPCFLILGCVCAVYRHRETHKTQLRRGFGTSVRPVTLVATTTSVTPGLITCQKPRASTTFRNVASPTPWKSKVNLDIAIFWGLGFGFQGADHPRQATLQDFSEHSMRGSFVPKTDARGDHHRQRNAKAAGGVLRKHSSLIFAGRLLIALFLVFLLLLL